ncbi:MAG: restriction endonuclease subunit S [Patescibacteria group bacterium]
MKIDIKTWTTKKLGEIVNVDSGTWGPADNQGTAVLRSTNFTNYGQISFINIAYREVKSNKIMELALQPGDILLEKSGGGPTQPVGRVVFFDKDLDKKIVFGNFISRLKPLGVNNKYLFYYLLFLYKIGVTERLQNQTTGIRNLILKKYLDINVALPPSEVQQQIVEKLDAIRKLQEVNNSQISKIDDLYKNLINKEIKSNKYNTVKLAKVIKPQEFINPKKFPNDEYHYIDISSIDSENFSVDLNSIKQFKGKDAPSRARKKIEMGDILFSTVRPNLKRIAKVDFPTFNSLASTGFAVLRPDSNKVNPDYMGTIVCSGIVTEQVLPQVRGAAYPAVSDNEVFNVEIPLPERKKQDEIAEKFITLQKYRKNLIEQKEKLSELFESALNKLLNQKNEN